MKSKTWSLLTSSILLAVILITLVSAAFTVSPTTLTFDENTLSHTFTITNENDTELLSVIIPETLTINGFDFNIIGDRADINDTRDFTVELQTPFDISDINFGDVISGSLEIINEDDANETDTIIIEIENREFCRYDNNGELSVSIEDVNVIEGYGDDDDYWYPLDEIEIEIEVDNRGNEDIDNIELEWAVYTADGEEIMDGDEKDFDLKDGKDETLTFTFQIDPDDLDADTEDYIFYVRATGEIQGGEYEDENTCDSDSDSIEIRIERDLVILGDVNYPETISCGSEIEISGDVWNIGEDDQEDVFVKVRNDDFGINELINVGDIDYLESKKFSIILQIPENAEEKTHNLNFWVLEENGEIYENEEKDESKDSVFLKVEGCTVTPEVLISAEVISGGNQGEEAVLKATLTNLGSASAFQLSVSGYDAWASFKDISPSTIYIEEGGSAEVRITFDLNKDAPTGFQDFFLEITLEDGTVERQPITMQVFEKPGSSITGFFTEGSGFIKGFIIVDIIIIVIIIIVAVRMLKK